MPVALTDEQAALAAAIEAWAAAHDPADAVRAAESVGVPGIPDGFGALGLLGVALGADDLAATLAVAEAAGVAGRCLDIAVEYAKVREQFGHPRGSFQAVKHLCAEMLGRAEAGEALAWDAAAGREPLAVASAAALALDAAVDNAKDCIQVLGGIGFTWQHDAHLYLRRAWA